MSPSQATLAADTQGPLTRAELAQIDAYWRAANYLSVGQIGRASCRERVYSNV